MARSPKLGQHEIGGAGDVADTQLVEADAQQFARSQHFGHVGFDVGVVRHRGLRAASAASEFTL